MKNLRSTLFTSLGLVAIGGSASANSFNINEHDARVTGRGGAMAAASDDAAAIVFNPAGLALIDGTNISIGGSLYIAKGSYGDGTSTVETDSPPTPVPNIYFGTRINQMIAVGVGVHFPFGLAVSYPEGHPQATIAQDSDLRTAFISPTVGLNLDKQVPGLTVGVGIDIVPASIELKRALEFGDTTGTVDLAADTIGYGFRAGVMYHPPKAKKLKLGVMYRHSVKLDFEGQADFDIAEPFRSQLPPDGDATASITLPASVWGGIAYSPRDNLELEFDAVWIHWAQTFPKDANRGGDATSLTINLPGGQVSEVPQDYEDTMTYRLGVDYFLPKNKINLRAGLIYDPTPIPTTTQTAQLPDVDRFAITGGASFKLTPKLDLHLSALYIPHIERDSSDDPAIPIFHGTYGVDALVLSAGLSGTFGKKEPPPAGQDPVASKDPKGTH
jgi:long-chain fatty acid transport protein